MKRAEVWRTFRGAWHVCQFRSDLLARDCASFPTHADALAHALAEVGLATPTNPEPTEAP